MNRVNRNPLPFGWRRFLGAVVVVTLLLGPAIAGCLSLSPTNPNDDDQDDRPDEDEIGFADPSSPVVPIHFA